MLNVKYFAYGSNIDIDRLKQRVEGFGEPIIRAGTPYVLQDYHLIFNASSSYSSAFWCFANIIPRIGSSVEGILYDMTPEQFTRLDRYEALYEKHYFQIDRNTIACTYIAKSISHNIRSKPSLDYLNIIIEGCLASGLKRTYNELLQYKLQNYKLKKSKHKLTIPYLGVTRVRNKLF